MRSICLVLALAVMLFNLFELEPAVVSISGDDVVPILAELPKPLLSAGGGVTVTASTTGTWMTSTSTTCAQTPASTNAIVYYTPSVVSTTNVER